jgi:hypothetical protein
VDGKPGEIKAVIREDGGRVIMEKNEKTCPIRGRFEDVLPIDPAFTARIARLYPGRDFLAPLTPLRDHGTSSVKYAALHPTAREPCPPNQSFVAADAGA